FRPGLPVDADVAPADPFPVERACDESKGVRPGFPPRKVLNHVERLADFGVVAVTRLRDLLDLEPDVPQASNRPPEPDRLRFHLVAAEEFSRSVLQRVIGGRKAHERFQILVLVGFGTDVLNLLKLRLNGWTSR